MRLRLRPHRATDLEDAAGLWADPIITRYTSGRAFTREEVWARLLRYAGHWVWMGYGFWAMEEKETGEYAGEIGFAEFERAMRPRLTVPEAGWILAPRLHGKGYASEALRVALAWADERFEETACLIHPENAASIRLAERRGYGDPMRTAYRGVPMMLYWRRRG
jgi:RimJ/RimL family protein N-acetyltransferase